jgi:hypothetical protein
MNRDHRVGDERISALYEWQGLHHIHAVARSAYTGSTLEKEVFGSFLAMPMVSGESSTLFDYGDLWGFSTVLARTGEIGLVAVLDDACGAQNFLTEGIQKIDGRLSTLQLRELAARLAYANSKLRSRPRYYSEPVANGRIRIGATIPPNLEIDPPVPEEFGYVLKLSIRDMLSRTGAVNASQVEEHVRNGQWTFLFDEQGNFLRNE